MNIGIIGSGYVGLVAAACFSEMGNEVTCVDVDENKISNLKNGIIPIYEPGLESLVKNNQSKKRLLFTTNINDALSNSEIIFIAVGTQMGNYGSADLQGNIAFDNNSSAPTNNYVTVCHLSSSKCDAVSKSFDDDYPAYLVRYSRFGLITKYKWNIKKSDWSSQ